ncbi:phage head-tail connector protein [Streptococcus suis]|uniref:phage head-tail connector protein n=1 Tax=Streptococcus suis TaxID=1307 RepID=UPI000CF4225D|nr:phage head-tail connector protein [Streptococcus suis]
MEIIKQVKALLGISDNLQDDLLEVIQELTEAHFMAYTGQTLIPTPLEFIIVEIMVKRFNRIGSEGMSSHGVEGLSMSFDLDDFASYDKVIHRQFANDFQAGFKML